MVVLSDDHSYPKAIGSGVLSAISTDAGVTVGVMLNQITDSVGANSVSQHGAMLGVGGAAVGGYDMVMTTIGTSSDYLSKADIARRCRLEMIKFVTLPTGRWAPPLGPSDLAGGEAAKY